TTSGTATSYTDTGLNASTAYSYTVRAIDAAGNASAASNTATATTQAGTGGGSIDPTKWYQVINTGSGKCLDADGGSTANGTKLQQWTCQAGNTNQQWQFQPTTSGNYKVISRNSATLAWDVDGGPAATGDGAKASLWTYGNGTNQQFKPTALGNSTYTLTARHSAKCLDITDRSTANGARVQQWTCHNGPAQTYRLAPQS
ncbi:RICIN domain-containing protein, partial [Streptomyces sp. TRM 70351]|uniref:RICIN domain-containing protein n=1 Tax=Streptomyces sp. TRM 70351 TaxID=3116552 RepID=UPI002E7C3B25